MSKFIFHCLDPKDREPIIEYITAQNLKAKIPREYNPHSIEITGDATKLEELAQHYEKSGKVAVLYPHEHPKGGKGRMKPRFHKSAVAPIAKSNITPNANNGNTVTAMMAHYNFPVQNCLPPTMAVISLGGNIDPRDLIYYWNTILGYNSWANVLNVYVDGANPTFSGSNEDLENTLDCEILGGICPTATILLISAPNTTQGFYDAINVAISGTSINGHFYLPSVVSISWGAPETDWANSDMTAFDQLFNVGRSHGITVCVAAGDNSASDGVSGGLPHVDFPSSATHAVACGGTTISGLTETAWSYNSTQGWGTGGGISAYFTAPTWQSGIVTYPTGTTPSVAYLNGKRALPDIAMNADPLNGWTIFFNGGLYVSSIGGTSCVAPAVSGLIGLMNLSYLNGFTNNLYTIYLNATYKTTCFNDITIGSNDDIPSSTGVYNAGVGHDMCTGLGTPNGVNMYNALKTLN